jgi:hypothetical protein
MKELPPIDKTVMSVASLDEDDTMQYWQSCSVTERTNAIEVNRRRVYGSDRTASRLQRFLEVVELERR